MSQWQDISSAPRDRAILVWAQWLWGHYDIPEDEYPEYEARVAEYYDDEILSVTANPYSDLAINPTHWAEIPELPTKA